MNHHTVSSFWDAYHRLPKPVQRRADKQFKLLKENPRHPSLQLKRVRAMWSVRVDLEYRALALDQGGFLVWFWIGRHEEYEQFL